MKFFISAGEASGDIHAASLIRALRKLVPGAKFRFLGGDKMMQSSGTEPLIHFRDMAYMGFSEVLRNINKISSNLRRARNELRDWHADALILVDYPTFNLRLAQEAEKLGIPVFYFIPPKVWAWKKRRGHKIARISRSVISILPFENEFWKQNFNCEAVYVGNPSVGEVDGKLAALPSKDEFFENHGLVSDKKLLALLPGSRRGEIRNNLPIMDAVARRHPDVQAVIAAAPAIEAEFYEQYSSLPRVEDATFELLAMADAALVTSGTATLEAVLCGTPQIVCYRANGSRLAYNLFKRILNVDYVSLPNLIADREIIPEQLLHNCTPELIDEKLTGLLGDTSARSAVLSGYADVRSRLGTVDAAAGAARLIVDQCNAAVVGGVVDT